MEFSTTKEERTVPAQSFNAPARTYTVIKLKGPCLVCEREMDYVEQWPYNEEHARKQFKPGRRRQLLRRLREGVNQHESPHISTIEGMVCSECLAESKKLREAAERQRLAEEQEHDRKIEEDRLARERHYAWRTVTAAEADPTPHSAEFRAVFPTFEMHEILFRWRATPGKCRGESYLMKVGMWVDGKLTAHYYGWNLQHFDENDYRYFYASEDEWPTEDLFGLGFCRWIERAFQPRLLQIETDQVWGPGGYSELDTEAIRRPGTLLVEWIDGSRYVHILPNKNLPEVAEWAEKNLELRIEERAFRPVRRTTDESEEVDADES